MSRFAKLFVASLLMLTACQENSVIDGKTAPCVGIDYAQRNPDYQYCLSTRNVILAVIFSETIIVPAIVILEEAYCPIASVE